MRVPRLSATAVVSLTAFAATGVIPGDARKGAQVFQEQKCVTCHSVDGTGGKSAPDLSKKSGRGYTPADMAALMWNHAPAMWTAMEQAGIEKPKLTAEQSADLFAYFYAARYFDRPGDAARGRRAFISKGCAQCHNVGSTAPEGGKPVMTWKSVSDPIELAREMWNHAPQMRQAMADRKVSPPTLTADEMNDIVVYLQNLPQTRNLQPEFSPASPETGETLFQVKGCAECHRGAHSLDKKTSLRTGADYAAAMWNHSHNMIQLQPELRPEEMRRLVGYIWALQFANTGGSAARGHKVFEAKGCGNCHGKGAAPSLDAMAGRANPYTAVSALWNHGPNMLKQMQAQKIRWPRFKDTQMADLLAYLNAGK